MKTISFPGLWHFPPFLAFRAKKEERERTRQFSRNCFCGMGNGGCSALGLLCRTFFPKRGRGNWMHNFSRMPIRRRWKTGKLPFRTPKHPYYNNEFPNPSNWKPYIVFPKVCGAKLFFFSQPLPPLLFRKLFCFKANPSVPNNAYTGKKGLLDEYIKKEESFTSPLVFRPISPISF